MIIVSAVIALVVSACGGKEKGEEILNDFTGAVVTDESPAANQESQPAPPPAPEPIKGPKLEALQSKVDITDEICGEYRCYFTAQFKNVGTEDVGFDYACRFPLTIDGPFTSIESSAYTFIKVGETGSVNCKVGKRLDVAIRPGVVGSIRLSYKDLNSQKVILETKFVKPE